MMYDTTSVRRQDRLLSEQRALQLLENSEYGFLAMASAEGGYGVPMNFVFDGQTIYLHCAPEGRKLRAIEHDARVSFCVVGPARLIAQEFTTAYESVVVQGRARRVTSEEECHRALSLLVAKFSPQYKAEGEQAIARSLHRTAIVAIDIETISGKSKQPKA